MEIEYDQEADALYVQFREVHLQDNIYVEDSVTVDVYGEGHIIGLEILDAAKKFRAGLPPQGQH